MTNHTQNNQLQIRSDELIMRGQELEDIGKLDEAEEYYLQAVKIAPNPTKAHLNLGNIYLSKDDPVTATEQYRLSLKYDPNNGSAYANLGRIDLLQNNYSGAVNHFMRGTKLLSGRAKGEANVGLGFALTKLNQNKQAEQALREAIGIVPKHPFANLHLGRLLMISGKSVDAAEHLNIAVKELPNNWNVHSWLGKVFADQGFILKACQHMEVAEKLNPQDAYNSGMHIFTKNYLADYSSEKMYESQLKYAIKFFAPHYPANKMFSNSRQDDRPLKIGYVSADLRKHPVSRFVEPLLKQHNRKLFEVHCYYNHSIHDDITLEIMSLTDYWHEIYGMSDSTVAKLITEHNIDILIDLNGLTEGHRLGVFARKPSPVQMTWLGYLGTTGVETIDYRICDSFTDPISTTEKYHTERLIRLPHSQWCHAPYRDLPSIRELPLLRNKYITFGSFNNAAKLNDEVLVLWAKLINEIPNSRICFAAIPPGPPRERILEIFHGLAIERYRVEFNPRYPYKDYLASIGGVDISLDPFPYNGGTTSFDTLIMGVPFITFSGERSISRGGMSILSNLDLTELIAITPNDYIQKACDLANAPAVLKKYRSNLRERLINSPLMDTENFTHNLEQIYRERWREWCDSACSPPSTGG